MLQQVPTPRSRQQRASLRALRLPRAVQRSLEEFQRRALTLYPDEISRIVLYGSYARGAARPDSDVDVLVVGRWPAPRRYLGGPGDRHWRSLVNAAVDSMVTGGPFISVVVMGEDLYNSEFPLAKSAREEGRLLWTTQLT